MNRTVLWLTALLLLVAAPSRASDVAWRPPGMSAGATPSAPVLSALARANNAGVGQHIARYRITSDGRTIDATAMERGLDYRIDLAIDGSSYSFGRHDGIRWRRSPAGVVRVIRSDVQGDQLDRWPLSVFGFAASDCSVAGEVVDPKPAWMLHCESADDVPHWYAVDKATYRIIREFSREGTRVVRYDMRSGGGWHVSGGGVEADVQLLDMKDGSVDKASDDIPGSVMTSFRIPDAGVMSVPVRFDGGLSMRVPVQVNGHTLRFVVDTGTTQTLMDVGAAARLGLKSTLGHAIAGEVRVGDAVAANLPVQTVDLFHGALDGLLGNEFFGGHVVHLSYQDRRLELIAHEKFVPPAGARQIDAYCDEGLPLVTATVGTHVGERFAIDTGSPGILLSQSFADPFGDALTPLGRTTVFDFLEGRLTVQPTHLSSLTFGGVRFAGVGRGYVARPAMDDLDFPLDGILGTDLLQLFDWWFDYDNNRVWVKFRG